MVSASNVSWPIPAAELESALHLAGSMARADMSVLLLHDERTGIVVPVVAHGLSAAKLEQVGAHRAGADPFGVVLSERHSVVVREAWRREATLARLAQSLGFRSIEIIPLIGLDGHVVGEIAMMFRRSRGSSRRALRMIERCAQLIVFTVQHAQRAVAAERAREKAEEAGRARIQFLARMSHELRTPLQSIVGYLDLMLLGDGQPPTAAQARMLVRMQQSSAILTHVIEDLITFSRIEAGGISYDICPVSAEEVIAIAAQVVAPLAAPRNVTVEPIPCPGVFVAADGIRLKQILVNLAANAVKFANASVRLSCEAEAPGSTAVFTVLDDGPGIPASKIETIFEPYVQLKAPVVDGFGGSGLGLAISREFAQAMHGELSVSRRPAGGSVFSLRLPRVRGDGSPLALRSLHAGAAR